MGEGTGVRFRGGGCSATPPCAPRPDLIPLPAMSSAHDNRLPHNVHLQSKRRVDVRRVDECGTLDEIFRSCLPAFGGAYLRRVYALLDQAIGAGCPLTLAIAGPVTVSG